MKSMNSYIKCKNGIILNLDKIVMIDEQAFYNHKEKKYIHAIIYFEGGIKRTVSMELLAEIKKKGGIDV